MVKDTCIKRRRDIRSSLILFVSLFLHLGGLALSEVRQIYPPHRRAPVQQAG